MSAVQPVFSAASPGFELKHILVTTDFSEYSRCALKQAAAIARLHGSDLVVVHVVPREPIVNAALEPATWEYETVLEQAQGEMTAMEKEAIGDVRHEYLVKGGSMQSALTTIMRERQISLVVLGTHGRTGVRKVILGSVAEQVFRFADSPVMTIGPLIEPKLLTHGRFESILFATDFSSGSKHALRYALGFAQESHANLTLLHVLDEGSVAALYLHEQLEKNARAEIKAMLEVGVSSGQTLANPPNVEVASGYPVEEILRVAQKKQADLIVLGVHKSSGIGARTSAHLPWTIASTVVCHAKCPVLTVRG